MSNQDLWILMGIGGGFIILGILSIVWGWKEEKSYFNYLSSRRDLREYIVHWPARPQAGALKIGGWIAIALGLILLGVGVAQWLMR